MYEAHLGQPANQKGIAMVMQVMYNIDVHSHLHHTTLLEDDVTKKLEK